MIMVQVIVLFLKYRMLYLVLC